MQWVHPNKIYINTGHKTFDKQTNLISFGSIISNTQYSIWIRPYNETKNFFVERPKGYLQDWDLNTFTDLPDFVRDYIKSVAIDDPVILYELRSYNYNKKIVHGYIITDQHYQLLNYFVVGPTYKSENVVLESIKYVTKKNKNKGSSELINEV